MIIIVLLQSIKLNLPPSAPRERKLNMSKLTIIWTALLLLATFPSHAQVCSDPGQTPEKAFPVCGTAVFTQQTVGICGTRNIPVPCTDGASYQDKNPYWYKFTCFEAGTLAFLITPSNLTDDYDWQLFDVTGHQPSDVFSDASLFVACNWSALPGKTGTSTIAASDRACAGNGYPNKSKMPTLVKGHNYLLLVSHFTDTQSGYQLSFNGGTASITDTTPPLLLKATSSCDGTVIRVKLNKNMKCSSLAADGSDFQLPGTNVQITQAATANCTNGFDMDSIILTLNGPLTSGQYQLTAAEGSDGNTLLDNCNNQVPVGQQIELTVLAQTPTTMDSLTAVTCAPQTLQLVFQKNITCTSIADDGSDFKITGPTAVTITSVKGTCDAGTTITIQLASPIVQEGTYQLSLLTGSDGNTLIDECGLEITPATLSFSVKDTVSAAFSTQLLYGCTTDTVRFSHDGRNGVTSWLWSLDDSITSTLQNPTAYYTNFGPKNIQLIVSNGFCSDTLATSAQINLDNAMNAAFEAPQYICPGDQVQLKNNSTGNLITWQWNFGNGTTSSLQTPEPFQYAPVTTRADVDIAIQLIVENNHHCFDTAIQHTTELYNCYIAVPSAFTPNGDGINDYLYPLNAYKATQLDFKVYNRYGQLVWETQDWTRKWDGTYKGKAQNTGTFVWTLRYVNTDTGKQVVQQGTTVLIR